MNTAENEINKLAVELYDGTAEVGLPFSPGELTDRLYDDLVERLSEDRSVVHDLIRIAADKAIKRVDKARTAAEVQPSLTDDLDRVVAVAGGNRRVLRHMGTDDWAAHISHVTENAARVNARAAVEQARYAALSPYLARGFDTEGAVAQWQQDHPEEVLP